MASDGNVDYFPFRTALQRFTFRDVQEEEVISTISYLSGGLGPRWDDIRVEYFKLIKNYICKPLKQWNWVLKTEFVRTD